MNYTKKQVYAYWCLIAIMMYVVYINMMHKWGHDGDMYFWMNWSKFIRTDGFSNIYEIKAPRCDYFPMYLYVLWLHSKLQSSMQNLQENIYVVKWFTLLFDFLGAYTAVWFVKDPIKKVALFIFLMLNIAYIYNTVQWGQVDAIFSFFGFAAIIAAMERKIIISIIAFLFSINFKLQAIVFIPLLGLLLLPHILTKKGRKQILIAIFLAVVLQIIILFPFIINGKLDRVFFVFTNLAGQYPYPSLCAFNIWFWFFPNTSIDEMYGINDGASFGFLTLRQIGNILFLLSMIIAVFPLMKYEYQRYIKKLNVNFALEKVFLIGALVPLCFFYFNTEMHERYSHPALLFLAAYAFCSTNKFRYVPLVLGSITYFLNLEKPLRVLALTNYETLIFHPRFGAALWAIIIGILFFLLYNNKIKTNEELNLLD